MRNKYDNLSFAKSMSSTHNLFLKNVKEFYENDQTPTLQQIKNLRTISFEDEFFRKKKVFWFTSVNNYDFLKEDEFFYNELRKNDEFIYNYYVKPVPYENFYIDYISRSKFNHGNNSYEKMMLKPFFSNFDKDIIRHGAHTSEFGRYRWIYNASMFYFQILFIFFSSAFVSFVIF